MTKHPIDKLFATIAARKGGDPAKSYTAKLLGQGVEKCAKKLGEEAVETALAAVSRKKKAIASESADVLYHLLVVWAATTAVVIVVLLRIRVEETMLLRRFGNAYVEYKKHSGMLLPRLLQ